MRKPRMRTVAMWFVWICILAAGAGNVLCAAAQEETEFSWTGMLLQEDTTSGESETVTSGEIYSAETELVTSGETYSDCTESERQEEAAIDETEQEAWETSAEIVDEEAPSLSETYCAVSEEMGAGMESAMEANAEIMVESVSVVDTREPSVQLAGAETVPESEEGWEPENTAVVTIPADVTSIDPIVFGKNKSIETILVDPGNPVFSSRDGILYDITGTKLLVYPAGRTKHTIPEDTTVIGRAAFIGQQISELVLPDMLIELETSAFGGVTLPKDTVLNLPPSLQTIGDNALEFSNPIKGIVIPPSVRSVGHWSVHADIVILQGGDTQLDEHPFFRIDSGMLTGGLPGSTAEAWVKKTDNAEYGFAELGEDGKIAMDPSWVYVWGFFAYSGKPVEPLYGITPEAPDQFYYRANLQISCSNNINAGWATAVVSVDDGVFSGSFERPFAIPPISIVGKKIDPIPSQVYTGKALRPKVEIPGLEEGKDFTVQYSKNVSIGLAEVTIRGIGNYGYRTYTYFSIVAPPDMSDTMQGNSDGEIAGTATWDWELPDVETTEQSGLRGTVISGLKAGKAKLTVKWRKSEEADGYQIQYSTGRNFKRGKKTRTVSGGGNNKCVLKNLKAKKKYYVRIRVYREVDGEKEYSAWSTAKKIKVK